MTAGEETPEREAGCALALAALFDAVLVAVAWLAETDAARSWLAGHKLVVVRAAGFLHVIAFPTLAFELLATGTRASELVTSREKNLASAIFPWALTGFYATSFIAPVAFGLGVAQEPYLALFMGYIFGPLALSGIGCVALLALEKRRGPQPIRLGAKWHAATAILILSYLSLTEYILVYAQAERGVWSGLMCLGAVVVSYVPMRAYFVLARARRAGEAIPVVAAFANLLYLLASV